ncbi:MAG TPA: DedA family protein [Candidatus Nanoarchaeia archaeon]|nr:DedA family protein [Candidatus Nanoarchaeia archaeon]
MNPIKFLINFVLHLDTHLGDIITQYGAWSYFIVFLIIFGETGLVIAPLLPGDSLLFAAGALAAAGSFNIAILVFLLIVAAILGDTLNYHVGRYFGKKAFSGKYKFLKKEYLDRTNEFYKKYGKKTIVLARFMPIVRTFAPFVAGVGRMNYFEFLVYNVIGGVLWVSFFTLGGYFFGNIPIVKENFSIVILVIIFVSLVPIVLELWRHRKAKKK